MTGSTTMPRRKACCCRNADLGTRGATVNGLARTYPTDPNTNRLTGTLSRPIAYDSAGNMTQWGTATYTYDELNMQQRLQEWNDNEYYIYTADDERIAIIEADSSNTQTSARWMLRDLENQVARTYTQGAFTSSPMWEKDYIRRDGQILAKKLAGGSIKHAHLDHLGTPRYWTNNSNGSGFSFHDYLPFGEEVTTSVDMEEIEFTGHERDTHFVGNCSPDTVDVDDQTLATGQVITACTTITSEDTTVTSADEVRFTAGEEVILEAGFVVDAGANFLAEIDGNLQADSQDLDYTHARFMSPYLGRFLNVDRIGGSKGNPGTWNGFTYVLNNPLRLTDPTGLACEDVDETTDDCEPEETENEGEDDSADPHPLSDAMQEFLQRMEKLYGQKYNTLPDTMCLEGECKSTSERVKEALTGAAIVVGAAAALGLFDDPDRNPADDQRLSDGETKST